MTVFRLRVGFGLVLLVGWAWLATVQPGWAKPLGEQDLAALARLGIGDDAIIAKIQKDGINFASDDAALNRIKEAGASQAVLDAVKKAGQSKQPGGPAVTYQDVIQLLDLKIDEAAIIKRLESSPTVFTLGAAQIDELKRKGASDRLIAVMTRQRALPNAGESNKEISDLVLILDCSGSMKEPTQDGGTKMEAAKRTLSDLVGKIPDRLHVAMIVYGHDVAQGCGAVKVLRPLGELDQAGKEELVKTIAGLGPVGHTPIALALETAGKELARSRENAAIVLVTDGMETCHGKPDEVAARLAANPRLAFGVSVIGFGVNADEQQAVQKIAAAGKGKYYTANSASQLAAAFHAVVPQQPAAEVPATPIMVWVERRYDYHENPLHSEFIVNGRTVDIFTSDTRKEIGKHLVKGWNTITIKTTPQEPANDRNELFFSIGPVHKDPKRDRMVMEPVLWKFRNGDDWELKDGKFAHQLGPGVKEATLSFRLHFAGLDLENQSVENGDYVVQGEPRYDYHNSPVVATVFVNGTPLNSFCGHRREVLVTPLLKQGRNDIKLVSERVPNAMTENDITIDVIGPLHYDAHHKKFQGKPIAQMKAMQGWQRDDRTAQLVNKANPEGAALERAVPFMLEETPAVARRPGEAGGRR